MKTIPYGRHFLEEDDIEAVENVLESIGALQRPRLSVFNKIDSVTDEVSMLGLRARYPGAVFASALTKEGLPELRLAVMRHLLENGNGQPRVSPADEPES